MESKTTTLNIDPKISEGQALRAVFKAGILRCAGVSVANLPDKATVVRMRGYLSVGHLGLIAASLGEKAIAVSYDAGKTGYMVDASGHPNDYTEWGKFDPAKFTSYEQASPVFRRIAELEKRVEALALLTALNQRP